MAEKNKYCIISNPRSGDALMVSEEYLHQLMSCDGGRTTLNRFVAAGGTVVELCMSHETYKTLGLYIGSYDKSADKIAKRIENAPRLREVYNELMAKKNEPLNLADYLKAYETDDLTESLKKMIKFPRYPTNGEITEEV